MSWYNPSSLSLITGYNNSTAGVRLPRNYEYEVKYWIPADSTADTTMIITTVTDYFSTTINEVPIPIGSSVVEGKFKIKCSNKCIDFLVNNYDPSNPLFTIPTTPYSNLTIIPI